MRPEILYPLFKAIGSLPGLGPRLAPLYTRLVGGETVVYALWHMPSGIIDRRFSPRIAEAPHGAVVTLTVTVEAHLPAPVGGRSPWRVRCADESGFITLAYFHAKKGYIENLLPVGATLAVSGRVEESYGERQMLHPDYVVPVEQRASLAIVEAIYPLTTGISAKMAAKVAAAAMAITPALPEWLDPAHQAREGWSGWRASMEAAHAPENEEALSPLSPPRRRLAYDELLANQLALLMIRQHQRAMSGRAIGGDGRLRAKALAALPFALTTAQSQAVDEITADMASPERMVRLLQGDVGSGKTVVALLALLTAVESGAQGALLAPTEILARQHAESLAGPCIAAGVRLAVFTGRDKGKAREALMAALVAGEIDILIGTHALIGEGVIFRDLALAVIDEQHRFGVHQRLDLAAKGRAVDMLVMTATPIPRTLTLTLYGDMDVSRLLGKPPGRQPVTTRILSNQRLPEVITAIQRTLTTGAKVYWVCPLVEESETSDLAAAEARYAALREIFGERVGLIHGRLKGGEKEAVMNAFAGDGLDILVATTVIEVGVNVPTATVMVIEHAERFGLAQLHQLRGRVGRGMAASSCLLVYAGSLSTTAKQRLTTLRDTEDGFVIAEEDLKLRGGGELLGTRQAGIPEFHLADLMLHSDLLATARDDAKLIVARDPELTSPRGQALRVLLYLFERDAAVKTLRSG